MGSRCLCTYLNVGRESNTVGEVNYSKPASPTATATGINSARADLQCLLRIGCVHNRVCLCQLPSQCVSGWWLQCELVLLHPVLLRMATLPAEASSSTSMEEESRRERNRAILLRQISDALKVEGSAKFNKDFFRRVFHSKVKKKKKKMVMGL